MPISLKDKVLLHARENENIRAVLLNGSRANPLVTPDVHQDYDIVYVVDNLEEGINETTIHRVFGKPIIQQLPDAMLLGRDEYNTSPSFAYLMIFEDYSRLDLTLYPLNKLENYKIDSLSIVLLDKDNLFGVLPTSSDIDYHVQQPTQRDFTEVCNEFWWCATNVAKGLARQEIVYAKDMMENVVRPMFLQLLSWQVGSKNNFSVSVGKSGKYLKKYLTESAYNRMLKTYSDATISHNWEALLAMCLYFEDLQIELGQSLHLNINSKESNNSFRYITHLKN
ncbi:MAG: aminoglycoside 6-adenylyltransferase [Flavobacteriaceae bacterium]|jgi:aminoglycoside 6-adenylyltransferase|nr:aminoglycoside 6-adenylyltransferase [Flavobacteriaceae bacterium]